MKRLAELDAVIGAVRNMRDICEQGDGSKFLEACEDIMSSGHELILLVECCRGAGKKYEEIKNNMWMMINRASTAVIAASGRSAACKKQRDRLMIDMCEWVDYALIYTVLLALRNEYLAANNGRNIEEL